MQGQKPRDTEKRQEAEAKSKYDMAAASRRCEEGRREILVGRKGAGWPSRRGLEQSSFGRWHPIAWTLDHWTPSGLHRM